jgi:two-component system NarL family response regulator
MSTVERIRVLIADGDTPTRDELRHVIEKDDGFEVCAEAANAAGAVSTALRKRPDICVLDVRLPGGGVAATWEIGGRLPRAKVVMLTQSAEDAELFAALRAGAEGYLLKTSDFANVPSALYDVWAGQAAVDPAFVARLLRHFRLREPRWRNPVSAAMRERSQPEAAAVTRGARLTSREWEVLDLLAHNLSTADISRELMISATAVRVHIAAVVRKLGVPDRAAAAEVLRGDASPGGVQATERPVAPDVLLAAATRRTLKWVQAPA